MGKTENSLENSESKGSSQNTLKSFLFDWDLFLALIL